MNNTESLLVSRRELLGGLVAGSLTLATMDNLLADTRVAKATPSAKSHVLAPALKIARASREQLEKVEDYTVLFYKDEVVGSTRIKQKMQLKIREKPFSVYIKFLNPHAGREVIYVNGQNDNKILVHGTGIETIVGTLHLTPTSSKAMEESRYPVTMIGMRKLTEVLIKQWESELELDDIAVKFYPNARIGDLQCKVIQSVHKTKQKGVKFHMSRLYVDKASGFPIRVEQFGFPKKSGGQPPMIEQYTYLNLKTNNDYKAIDFSEKNPKYDF
jgi:hypothetical protein